MNIDAAHVIKVQQEQLSKQLEEITMLRAAIMQMSQETTYREGDDEDGATT